MTFHHLRAPRPGAARPAAKQPGPVTLALRTMQAAMTTPPASGPVTEAIRVMRSCDPAFDDSETVRALRRALARRIEGDIAVLDMLGGDPDLEPSLGAPESTGRTWETRGSQEAWASGGTLDGEDDAGENREEENEHGADDDAGEPSLCGLEVGPGDSWDREGGDIQDVPHDAEEDDDRDSGCGDAEGALEAYGGRTGIWGAYA